MQGLQQRLDAKSSMPDLILLDINMPVMDGWQFIESFLVMKPQIQKEITIYVVSSSIAPSDKDKAYSYTAIAGFISKPLDVETLQKLLQVNTVQ
jgi:CheY-like chemotaxis protein